MSKLSHHLEDILENSYRPTVVLTDARKHAIWDKVMATTPAPQSTPTARWWRQLVWLIPITSAGALAVVIWLNTQPSNTSTELVYNQNANTITNTIISNNNNDTNTVDNTNTLIVPEVVPETKVASEVRLNHMSYQDFYGMGGGPGTDYGSISFQQPTSWPEVPTQLTLQLRSQLALPELYQLASLFGISQADLHVGSNGSVLSKSQQDGCEGTLFSDVTQTCLVIQPNGRVHFMPSVMSASALSEAANRIAKLTGLLAGDYVEVDAGAIPNQPDYHQYRFYYPDSLTDDGLYQDLGWLVITKDGNIHSLSGYILPELTEHTPVALVTPEEAWQRLVQGFKPYDRDTNPNTARLSFDTFALDTLLSDSPEPDFTVGAIHLMYSYATGNQKIGLVPVYYLIVHDNVSGQDFEFYIDASTKGDLFQAYHLVTS